MSYEHSICRLQDKVYHDGLVSDASRFCYTKDVVLSGNPLCKICCTEPEDVNHFIVSCPHLSDLRRDLILIAPASVSSALPDIVLDCELGVDWIDDQKIQELWYIFAIDRK